MTPWYDQAFGPWYLKLYPHRSLEEARNALEALDDWIPRGLTLDVGCGSGRYLTALRETGRAVVGLDRSRTLLGVAAQEPRIAGSLIRGDMRHLPFSEGRFASVLSMFTSFGYFGSREAHVQLLAEYSRVVKRGGRLILDYLNASAVRESLVPESDRRVDDHTVHEKRFLERSPDGDIVVKELRVHDPTGSEVASYREQVSLYDRDTLLQMLRAAGWKERQSFGDYRGSGWSPDSDRLITIAERESLE